MIKGSLDQALALLNRASREAPKPMVRREERKPMARQEPKIRKAAPTGFSLGSVLDDKSLENLKTCMKR